MLALTLNDLSYLVALLYVHDTWMSIERKRVRGEDTAVLPEPSRGDFANEGFDDAYDDISRSDDVSEAVHAPAYQVRQERGQTVRGSDRLTVSVFLNSKPRGKNSE